MEDCGSGGNLPFARGGPLYIPNLVGPLTSVPDYQAAIIHELHSLQTELSAAGDFDDELSVDELKVFTEEELVERALEALEGTESEGVSSAAPIDNSVAMESAASPMSDKQIVPSINPTGDENLCSELSCHSSSVGSSGRDRSEENGQHISKKRKKRGRHFDRDTRASELNNINFRKIDHFVKIKQHQDEDRAAARLHSFQYGSTKSALGRCSMPEKTGRLQSLRFIECPLKGLQAKSLSKCQNVPVQNSEVVLCVEVYDNRLTGQKNQELLILGTQRLTALRDCITCSTDQLMQAAGQYDPSGYFLIEDLFLNDMRDPLATDYSKPILEWLLNSKMEAKEKWQHIISGEIVKHRRFLGNLTSAEVPQFQAVDMHRIHFRDLIFRLGSGYLYCHQGNCKHIIVIRDMRLIHPQDQKSETAYPIVTFQLRTRQRKCSVCKIKFSVMMTVDDKWAAKNPCYFCKDCYYLLHYKEDNSLLYDDFNVYDLESCLPMSKSIDTAQNQAPSS